MTHSKKKVEKVHTLRKMRRHMTWMRIKVEYRMAGQNLLNMKNPNPQVIIIIFIIQNVYSV